MPLFEREINPNNFLMRMRLLSNGKSVKRNIPQSSNLNRFYCSIFLLCFFREFRMTF
jgi:hypothetical protein